MAQKTLVLDIGSYSVKRLTARIPLVGYAVSDASEIPCPSALEPRTRKPDQVKAARELLPGKRLAGEAVAVVMPAERVLNRFVQMPFSDSSKINNTLGFELENHVPLAAGEFLFDWIMQEKRKDGATLFASVVADKEVEELRELLSALSIDPRVVVHQAVANARLVELMSTPAAASTILVDFGHRKTVVTLVRDGRFAGARVLLHGGYDLTRALAEQLGISPEEAQTLKHEAHLFPAGDGLAVGRVQEIADALKAALKSLVRDLHQSVRAFKGVEELHLFGGGAKLGGIETYLSAALGLPVHLLRPSSLRSSFGSGEEGLQYLSAAAAGYAGAKGSDAQRINFRQGPFAYLGDFRFMRGRVAWLGVMVLLMLAGVAAPQVMRYRSVLAQQELMRGELGVLSLNILGKEMDDWDEVLSLLEKVPSAEVWTVFPDLSAHDIYWEVADIVARIDGQPTGEAPVAESAPAPGPAAAEPTAEPTATVTPAAGEGTGEATAAPAGPSVAVHNLEMNQIRIDGASRTAVGDGVVEFTGNASSVATMELYLTRLGQHPCFRNVQRTKQEVLKATAGREGWWRFTVEFTVSCPRRAVEGLQRERETTAGKEAEAGKAAETPAPEGSPAGPPTGAEGKGPAGGTYPPKEGGVKIPGHPEKSPPPAVEALPVPEAAPAADAKPAAERSTPSMAERSRGAAAERAGRALAPEVDTALGGGRLPGERAERGRLPRPGRGELDRSRPLTPPLPHERLGRSLGRE